MWKCFLIVLNDRPLDISKETRFISIWWKNNKIFHGFGINIAFWLRSNEQEEDNIAWDVLVLLVGVPMGSNFSYKFT